MGGQAAYLQCDLDTIMQSKETLASRPQISGRVINFVQWISSRHIILKDNKQGRRSLLIILVLL
jgi:hypothetical protein